MKKGLQKNMDVSVLERQRARLKWLQLQDHLNYSTSVPQFPMGTTESGAGETSFRLPERAEDLILMGTTESSDKMSKRKAEACTGDHKCKNKRTKGEKEVESNVKAKCSTEVSSKENSKPDYVHVRARRGQATDSHSLAERARREKINKKMKCLQSLVPGCNKISGKAGMLDEIINYVQSLQTQVEFLSMKLAAASPRLGFNMDYFSAKEFPAYVANFPAVATAPTMTCSFQFNSTQDHGTETCILDSSVNPLPRPEASSPSMQQIQSFQTFNPGYSMGFH